MRDCPASFSSWQYHIVVLSFLPRNPAMSGLEAIILAAAAYQPAIMALKGILDLAWDQFDHINSRKDQIRSLLERCQLLSMHCARAVEDNKDISDRMLQNVNQVIKLVLSCCMPSLSLVEVGHGVLRHSEAYTDRSIK